MTSSGIEPRNLPACSIVPQPATLPRAPIFYVGQTECGSLVGCSPSSCVESPGLKPQPGYQLSFLRLFVLVFFRASEQVPDKNNKLRHD
jgi:hypothetical protein